MNKFPTLYKRDVKGGIREWFMEVDGDRYRTTSGLQGGQKVTTEWTVAEAKNVGRANATTAEEQAVLEVESQYKKKLAQGAYHKDVKDIDKKRFFKPMLAAKWENHKDKIDWSKPTFIQPKLDGIRCIATAKGLFSRNGKEIIAVPHIMEHLRPLFEMYPGLVIDGELYNHDLKDDFNKIVSLVRKTKPKPEDLELAKEVQYHVYDSAHDMTLPFSERITQIADVLGNVVGAGSRGNPIKIVSTMLIGSEEQADDLYGKYLEAGYEGGIIRLNEPYQQKRSNFLLKRKDFEDAEFEIIGIEEGKGNWSGVAKRVHCRMEDGTEFFAGLKGSREYAAQVLREADQYIGKQVTVQYFQLTSDGIPRFPIAKQLYKEQRM